MGASYVTALVIVDLAALFIHDEAGFGVFHALAIVSLVTVATALVVIAAGRRRPAFVATHAYCMAWSYAGLVAAGCGQVTTTVGDASALMVLVVILAALAVSGVAIHTRVPSALVAVLR